MEKDTRLINIYLNIHHKKTLTMDDLRYLAQYAPECFEKTCKNVVYNIPETKPIMDPAAQRVQEDCRQADDRMQAEADKLQQKSGDSLENANGQGDTSRQEKSMQETAFLQEEELAVSQNIEQILENLKLLETNDFPVADVNANEVKNLLGNLYMELLFPHNDKDTFFNTAVDGGGSIFDRKV